MFKAQDEKNEYVGRIRDWAVWISICLFGRVNLRSRGRLLSLLYHHPLGFLHVLIPLPLLLCWMDRVVAFQRVFFCLHLCCSGGWMLSVWQSAFGRGDGFQEARGVFVDG